MANNEVHIYDDNGKLLKGEGKFVEADVKDYLYDCLTEEGKDILTKFVTMLRDKPEECLDIVKKGKEEDGYFDSIYVKVDVIIGTATRLQRAAAYIIGESLDRQKQDS